MIWQALNPLPAKQHKRQLAGPCKRTCMTKATRMSDLELLMPGPGK